MKKEEIKNPNRSRAAWYFLILLGIDIAVELRGITPKQEIKKIKRSIRKFLDSNQKVLVLEYKDTYLNPTKYYHKVLQRNPLAFVLKLLIMSLATILPASEFKNFWYRLLGMNIGRDVSISAGAIFDLGYPKLITINDGAIIGTGVKILTHETTIQRIRVGRVYIGRKALIGVRSLIRSGVTIGDKAVVGACSFVNKDVAEHEFVGGVPAQRIKMLKKAL